MFFILFYFIHYTLYRKDNLHHRDIFVREVSLVNETKPRKFFLNDICRFDLIKSEFFFILIVKQIIIRYSLARRGFEAINVKIEERYINDITKLPKIKKKPKNNEEQATVSTELFQATMYV